jgi:DnaJ-class molecular chaperone
MNPDDKTAKKTFQKLQAAFEVLNDPKKREMYDRYGSSFETMGGGPRGEGVWGAAPGAGGFNFQDFDFSQVFGARPDAESGEPGFNAGDFFGQFRRGGPKRRASTRGRRGADIAHEISIPFTTSITGGEIQIAVTRQGGRHETLAVKLPPGIEDGKRIRLRGQGEQLSGGTAGDILLTVHVEPHAHFQRRNNHLIVRVPVTFTEAAFGAKIDIPSPKGTVSLHVPPCTSSGTKLRVKGLGVAAPNGPVGDLLAEIQIVLPKSFDEDARTLIHQLEQHMHLEPRTGLRW